MNVNCAAIALKPIFSIVMEICPGPHGRVHSDYSAHLVSLGENLNIIGDKNENV